MVKWKTLILLICFTALMMLGAGCTQEDTAAVVAETTENDYFNNISDENEINSNDINPTETEEVYEEYLICNDREYQYYGFSENRAWVVYVKDSNPGERFIGVIDENGVLVYEENSDDYVEIYGGMSVAGTKHTPFKNGTSCIYYDAMGSNGGGMVIDKDGNTLFTSDDQNDSTDFYYLGYGDDKYMWKRIEKGFDKNQTSILFVDCKGGIEEKKLLAENESDHFYDVEYIGDGIWKLGYNYLYNYNTNAVYDCDEVYHSSICSSVHDGYIVLHEAGVDGRPYIVKISELNSQEEFINAANNAERGTNITYYNGSMHPDYIYDEVIGTFLTFKYINRLEGYCDVYGNVKVSIKDNTNYVTGSGEFKGNFAPIQLRGLDRENYITIINHDGIMQFEPIKGDMSIEYSDEWFYNQKNNILLDTTGKQYTVGQDDISFLNDAELGNISGGWIRTDDNAAVAPAGYTAYKYVSLDGKKEITHVKYKE